MQISETAQKIITLLAAKPNLQARDIGYFSKERSTMMILTRKP